MLHLSVPFMGGRKGRLATIDASYYAAGRGEGQTVDGEFPLVDFSGETKLVPPREGMYGYYRISLIRCHPRIVAALE